MLKAQGLLVNHPTPQNVAAAKAIPLNGGIHDDVRQFVLNQMLHPSGLEFDARQRVDLLAEVFVKSGRIPEPYHTSEVAFIKRSFQVGYWRDRMIKSLLENPEKPGAVELLQHLGTDAVFEDGGDALWAARFRAALVRLESDRRAPADLKQGARKTRELLDERKRRDIIR